MIKGEGVMRKSRYVTVLLAGAALAACDESPNPLEGKVFGDVAACTQEADPAACEQGFTAAKQEHSQQAPKFATKEECEAAGYSPCEGATVQTADGSSHSMFMPMMMGFMMGRMLGGGGMMGQGRPGAAPGPGPATTSRPVYGDRNGYLYTGNTAVGRVAPGTTSLSGQTVGARTVSRGGFGASGARYSSGGA